MLTDYQGKVFNAEIKGDKVNIWKYVPVEDFKKVTIRLGRTYYEKIVDMSEVGSFYSVRFLAYKDNRRFLIKSYTNDDLVIICDDQEYAKANGYYEMEHGVWCLKQSADYFDAFQLEKSVINASEKIITDLNINEFKDAWQIYVKEVEI